MRTLSGEFEAITLNERVPSSAARTRRAVLRTLPFALLCLLVWLAVGMVAAAQGHREHGTCGPHRLQGPR